MIGRDIINNTNTIRWITELYSNVRNVLKLKGNIHSLSCLRACTREFRGRDTVPLSPQEERASHHYTHISEEDTDLQDTEAYTEGRGRTKGTTRQNQAPKVTKETTKY